MTGGGVGGIGDTHRGQAWAASPPWRGASAGRRAKMTLAPDPHSWPHIVRVLLALVSPLALTAILARGNRVVGPSGEGAGTAGGYIVSDVEYNLPWTPATSTT